MPKKFLKRYMPDRQRIKKIKSLEFLGERLHAPNLWHLNRRSVSRAFAIGFWAMYTPPLPWQMVIAALLAISFDANVPIAVALVWITNPVTWVPMYYFAYLVGTWVLRQDSYTFTQFSEFFSMETAWDLGAPFLVGCFTLMNLGAAVGYFTIRWLWRRSVTRQWELRKLRDRPLSAALLANMSCRAYWRVLHHHHADKF